MIPTRRVKALCFDLDNTLYDERQYLRAAHRRVCHLLAQETGLEEGRLYALLRAHFQRKGSLYRYLFDDFLVELGYYDGGRVKRMVEWFHTVSPPLTLYQGARELLGRLGQAYLLALITNGRAETQRRKVQALGLDGLFREIVYAGLYGEEEKPSPVPYQVALEKLGVKAGEAVYVGDNPYTDFRGARELGMITLRLLKGEFAPVTLSPDHEADYRIGELAELPGVLSLIEGGQGEGPGHRPPPR